MKITYEDKNRIKIKVKELIQINTNNTNTNFYKTKIMRHNLNDTQLNTT